MGQQRARMAGEHVDLGAGELAQIGADRRRERRVAGARLALHAVDREPGRPGAAGLGGVELQALELQAGLFGIPKARRRTMELLRAVRLEDKADAYARTLSGG